MERIFGLARHHSVKRVGIFLITVALIAGMMGCQPAPTTDPESDPPLQHNLTVSSTTGGSVTIPGEGTFSFDEGEVVDLVAEPEDGYHFVGWAGDGAPIAMSPLPPPPSR
jgi:hypothetical protein